MTQASSNVVVMTIKLYTQARKYTQDLI